MDDLDRKIVTELQMNFPISQDPYAVIADKLGIELDLLLDRVRSLLDSGTIRRVGISVDSRKMGFSSTLAAVRVPEDRIEHASGIINTYPEITHSYLRNNQFNIWFTVIACDKQRIHQILEELRGKLEIQSSDVLDLPVKKLFKLDARFKPAK